MRSLSRVQLLATPWTAAYQAPPSMGLFQARVLEWAGITFSEKMLMTWKESGDQTRQPIKKQRHYCANEDLSSQGYGLSMCHVWM